MTRNIILLIIAFGLMGCANESVNDVSLGDAGQAYTVKFGTVLDSHPVNVRSKAGAATGVGALAGGTAGAILGNSGGALLAGAVVGGLAGATAHQVAESNNGFEYTIAFADGSTKVIDQIQSKSDPVFKSGDAVMVQFGATKNRVLPAKNLPQTVPHPKEVRVEGAPPPPNQLGSESCQASTSIGSAKVGCTKE